MHRIDGFIDINEFLNIDQLSDFKASELLNYLKRANLYLVLFLMEKNIILSTIVLQVHIMNC